MGLECLIAISQANPEKGVRYRHAWNVVKLKNTWYHLDATFDNSLGVMGRCGLIYYNLDDRDDIHGPFRAPGLPHAAVHGRDPFLLQREPAILTRVGMWPADEGRAGGRNSLFCVPLRRRRAERFGIGADCGHLPLMLQGKRGKYIRLSVNYLQAVMEIAVLEHQIQENICREEANEGELKQKE